MSYATPTEFLVWGLPQRTLDAGPGGAGAITTSNIQSFLDAAFGVVNGQLRRRYSLPLGTVPDEVKQAECVIAAYELAATLIGFNPENPFDALILRNRDDKLRWLADVAAGKHLLDADADATPGINDGGMVVDSSAQRGWGSGRVGMASEGVDPDYN